jgi:glycosyltransferase involved in cell wall biosynthesis
MKLNAPECTQTNGLKYLYSIAVKMYKVVQIQYSTGSGAKSAWRLQQAFINAGIQSEIISLEEEHPTKKGINYLGKKERLISKINMRIQAHKLKKADEKFGLFSIPGFTNNIANHTAIQQADVIYVHWVMTGFLNIKSFEQLAKTGKPIIFIMHDMWNITGGCHYSFDCTNYITNSCSTCQVFPTQPSNAKIAFQKKLHFYNRFNNLYFVSPSVWLQQCAQQSLLLKNKPVFYIPNALDITVFKPSDKKFARTVLNLPQNDIIVAFGAVSVTSPYKGWAYLAAAMQLLKKQNEQANISVLIFGSGYNKQMDEAIPFNKKFMGYLGDEYSTALVYNSADVFVVPSLADNQPTVVQESLACGTPVVGFNIGGIPDMIEHKKNGYLAEYKNAEDLVTGIEYCIVNKISGSMLPHFNPQNTINQHLKLFETINKPVIKVAS